MLSIVTTLVITGYGLYYASGEKLRLWAGVVHWAMGLTGMPALILHALMGKRMAANLQPSKPTRRQIKLLSAERAKRLGP